VFFLFPKKSILGYTEASMIAQGELILTEVEMVPNIQSLNHDITFFEFPSGRFNRSLFLQFPYNSDMYCVAPLFSSNSSSCISFLIVAFLAILLTHSSSPPFFFVRTADDSIVFVWMVEKLTHSKSRCDFGWSSIETEEEWKYLAKSGANIFVVNSQSSFFFQEATNNFWSSVSREAQAMLNILAAHDVPILQYSIGKDYFLHQKELFQVGIGCLSGFTLLCWLTMTVASWRCHRCQKKASPKEYFSD
jgi:hypothetical protein